MLGSRWDSIPKPDDGPMVFPPGWAAQSFENLFLFIDYRGKTPPKTNQGIPLITAKNIRMGYLNREPREYISEKTFKTWMTRGFPKIEDLFFTTEAPPREHLPQRDGSAVCTGPTRDLLSALWEDQYQVLDVRVDERRDAIPH